MAKTSRYTLIFLFTLSSLAIADQGSGDSYGYNWTDTETPSPTTTFSWIDLSSETSLFDTLFNDTTTSVTLPFSFTLYGTSGTQLYISSNGWLSFNNPGSNSYPANAAIPTGSAPNALIASFWDDLASTNTGGGVYYRVDGTSPHRRAIVEWDIRNASGNINFQAILYEGTNNIKFQYNTIDAFYDGGVSASVGIESNTGSSGLQYSFNTSGSVSENSAILFHNEEVTNYSASLLPGSVEINDFVSFTYTINNFVPTNAQNVGKIDRVAIGNPFSTTPTITSITIDGQSALIQNTSVKPTDPTIATWYYETAGAVDSLIVQTTQFNIGQSIAITYLQAIPEVSQGDYTYASTVDAELYTDPAVGTSSQPQVTVSNGSVDYITIRDASGGGGNVVGNLNVTTDTTITFYAAAYDAGDNYIEDAEVDWTVTGSLDGSPTTSTNFIFNPSTAPSSGTIQAEINGTGITDATGTISVAVGDLNSLQIRTESDGLGSAVTDFSMTTDDTQRFWAAGYDDDGNFRGNEPVSWTSTLGISGSGTSINYSPSAPITGTLTATSGSVNYVANIEVLTGVLDYLVIRDAPGGVGAVVGDRFINTQQSLTLYAAGYDAENNYKEDYVATWTLTGSLDQPGGTVSPFVFSPSTAPTDGTIIATVGNISEPTGTITVDPGPLASLEIRTAPDNGGSLVIDFPMTTDDSQTFWAAGFDAEGNFRGNESVTWTSTIGISGTGSSINFSPDTPVSGILTATSGIYFYTTGTIDVTVGALDYLIIRDTDGGSGSPVAGITMTADDNVILYAAGYDADDNFRQDENATWTLTGSLDGSSSSGPSYNFSPSIAPTTGSIIATVGSASDPTGTITVNPGALSYLLIRTGSGNSGEQVFDFPMTTDDTQIFWSAGYDAEGNYREDETATVWTSTGDLGLSGSGASITFTPTSPVSGTLIATVGGSTPYETGIINVSGGGIDYITIRNAPDGGGSEVGNYPMTTDETLTLYAAGYDAQNNFIENALVNWSLTGDLDGTAVSDTVFILDPATTGSGTIVAQLGGDQDATGTITVSPGALSSLLIRTESNNGGGPVTDFSMTTDDSQPFWSAGYDAEGNYRGDEASTVWTSSGDLGLSGSGASILFEPTSPVSGTLTATVGGSVFYETGTITVREGAIDHIIVRNAPDGGGTEVTTVSMTTDETLTLYAAGYDAEDNFIQNAQVNWTLTGSLIGTEVSDTVFVFDPADAPTSGTINAQIGNSQDATGTITVSPGALASLLIRDAQGGGGDVVTTLTMSAGESETFWAAGYDADGNFRQDEPATVWTSTFGLGGSGASFVFAPTEPGDGTITAAIDDINYTTGNIEVTSGTLAYLLIRDDTGGAGRDLTTVDTTLTADDSIILYAAGYDAEDNYIGDQLVDWYSTGDLDFIDASGTSYTFNPAEAPASGRLGITNGTFGRTTGIFTINVGSISSIRINNAPGPNGAEIGVIDITVGTELELYASSYDADGNYRQAVVVDWSSTGDLDEVNGTASSIIFRPVTANTSGTIVADTAGLYTDATGTITVEEGDLNYILLRTAADGEGVVYSDTAITADQSLTLYAAGYDAENNYLLDVSVSWSSTGSLDDVLATGTSYVFNPVTAPTSGTIVGTSGTFSSQTGTIDVSVGVLHHITINASSGSGGEEVETLSLTADDSDTFYAAGYDADNNYIQMVSAVWAETGSLDDVSGTGPSYVFNPTTAPTSGTITATFSGLNDATGLITVSPGALSYMQINDAGGTEIGDLRLNVGVEYVFYAAGYDQHGNYRGAENSLWRTSGSLDDITDTGESFSFTPLTANTNGTIIATSQADASVSDTTGFIEVEEGVLTTIKIRTATNGGGIEFGDYQMTTDDMVTLYAAGYDGGNNYISDVVVNWSSLDGLEPISETDSFFVFSPSETGTGRIRISRDDLIDDTGFITVNAGAPVSVTDADGLSGERTTVAGQPQLIRVLVEDQDGNGVPGITVNFSPSGDMSVPSDITDSDGIAESVYNTPSTADFSIVQVSVSGLSPFNFTVYGIQYVSGSLDPVVVQRGGTPSFTLQVSNPGNQTVTLSTGSSNFSFEGGSYTYSASLASPSSLPPNSPAIPLTFVAMEIDPNFPGGSYTGEIQLDGSGSFSTMNGVLATDFGELTIGTDAITIATAEIYGPNGRTSQLLQGDPVTARIPVLNDGPALEIDPFSETRIEFRRADNGQIQPVENLQRTDGNIFLEGGGATTYLEFDFDLPSEYQTGQINISVRLSLDEGNLVVEGPSGGFEVLQAGNANYVAGSLDPQEVVPLQEVYFSASFENTGSASIILDPATSTIEILGSGLGQRPLISQFILTRESTTEIFFDPLTIPEGLSPGNYNVRWRLRGTLINGSDFDTTDVISGELSVVPRANLIFNNINIVPDRVKQGQAGVEIVYLISNQGQSAANISAFNHRFNRVSGGSVPAEDWTPVDLDPQIPFVINSQTTRTFTVTYTLSQTATTGFILPDPVVSYQDILTPSLPPDQSNVINQNDQVEVVEPASVKIVELEVLSPNAPYVNENQSFDLDLTVQNTGSDQIATVWLSLYRNSETEPFTDQIILTNIASDEQKSTTIQHSESAANNYLYKAYIDSALDAVGDPVLINQPDDRDELVTVQVASRLEIDAVIVANSINYDSLIVSEDQTFAVQAKIRNFGESSFSTSGNGRLALRLPSDNFAFIDEPSDSLRTFSAEDTVVEWPLLASDISPGGNFEALTFSLITIPVDTNTGNPVSDITILDSTVHLISEEKGRITQNTLAIISPVGAQDGILSTKQEFLVEADIQFNTTIADEGKTATLYLPPGLGYSLKQGQQLTIDLSAGGEARWTVIAPDRDQRDEHFIFVTASGYDRNSGLEVVRESNQISIRVQERTDLVMNLQIIKSGGAPGDTLSVGQKFTLQAIITNDGDALAEGEGTVYLEGIGESESVQYADGLQEDTLTYTIGQPVSWDLEVIQLPDGFSALQSQVFQIMDELEKEKAKKTATNNQINSNGSRVRQLFNQLSDLISALVTVELNLTVRMKQIPIDENTSETAFTEDSVVTKSTYIQPVASISFQDIISPDTVSTEQEFEVFITASPKENLDEAEAHLLLPESFKSANDNQDMLSLQLDDDTYQARFQINVPSTVNYNGAARESLKVYLTGIDRNSGEQVSPSNVVPIDLNLELRPEIFMDYEIIAPIAARASGSLSHGQTITVDVWPSILPPQKQIPYAAVVNDGNIELDNEIFSRYNFEPLPGETYKQTFTSLEQKKRFTLRAPRENATALLNFRFVDLPEDNNSGLEVKVSGDSGFVSLPMTVAEKKITVTMRHDYIDKTTFTRGEGQHLLMAFNISNVDYLDPLHIQGLGIKIIARSDTSTLGNNAVLNILEKISIVDLNEFSAGSEKISSANSFAEYIIDEQNVSNPLQINFDVLDSLAGEESKEFAVVATFRQGESSRSFRTRLNNVDAFDDSSAYLVSIVDEEGRPIQESPSALSDIISIISNNQEQTFGNFPNPFGRPPNETTDIRFFLKSTSNVNLRVFSLAGELVRSNWNRNLSNLPGGEIYYVVWDGKNDEGDTVLNGVYICVIEIDGAEGKKTYTTKIAYIK